MLSMNGIIGTIQNTDMVKDYYVTSAEVVSFNCFEGNIYHVNIKLVTKEGYKNKIVTIDEEYNFETLISYGSKTYEEWLDEACLYNNLDKTVFVKIGESDE